MSKTGIISKQELLEHWLGHRGLTRRVIEAFPEKELFEFSIGGMRTFAEIIKELITIAAPGLEGIVNHTTEPFDHNLAINTKAGLLEKWDADASLIIDLYNKIPEERFAETFNLFGMYNFPIIHNIMYCIDNEIHHRGQGYVYLRALGIEPPFFWER